MRIQRRHHLGIDEARVRADRIAADLERQFSLRANWQGDVLQVRGNGIAGALTVEEERFELVVKLGLALKLMERPIRAAIEKMIDEELA